MPLSELTSRDAVLGAMREYDTLGQDAFLAKYGYSPARRYQLIQDGKSYDAKAIAGVAFGYQFPERGPLRASEFSGGDATVVPLLHRLNFDVQTINADQSVKTGLENFLATYSSIRSATEFGQHDELKNKLNVLRSQLEALPALRAHPRVRVSWSVGQGNFARIPWIALIDERETTSTQRGTYCVFLFSEDMSGVYLTLNQGVTTTINEKGRIEGRRILRERAETMRQIVHQQLPSFSLNNEIDLHTEGTLGQDYEASTIAYRYYAKGEIPEDAVLNGHIEELLKGYEQILQQQPERQQATTQWWIFQANPKFYNIDDAIHDLSEITWTVKHDAMRASVGDRVFFGEPGAKPA
jgi:5-methylcytosine-specific restriction enzyme B